MSAQPSTQARVTVNSLRDKKAAGDKIVCLTAYDASFASVLDANDVDVVLVGDSLGMVIHGGDTTLPVTMDDMLYHAKAVNNGLSRAMLMVDMPFLSYTSVAMALDNAGALMKRAGAQMVKLEGGSDQCDIVSALTAHGIPVCAHLGLQPQRVHKIGGYRVQGREPSDAEHILSEAQALQQAGADVMLLECVPAALAEKITSELIIPVIGIGAGNRCDGQILVLYDVLGISAGRIPKFSKNFLQDSGSIADAIKAYTEAVRTGAFPADTETFT